MRKESDAEAPSQYGKGRNQVPCVGSDSYRHGRYLADPDRVQRFDDRGRGKKEQGFDRQISENAHRMMEQGKQIFRYDTFGDEVYWTDKLKLHNAIQGSKFGGVGLGVTPNTALAVGLKVNLNALPQPLINQIKQGKGNLDDLNGAKRFPYKGRL
jgi:hypothetical protein